MKRTIDAVFPSQTDYYVEMSNKIPTGDTEYSYMNKKDLLKFSQEKCEFCEQLFFCRYDLLIHKAKHIIIPLRSEIFQCSQCNKHFSTTSELELHAKVDHFELPDILKNIVETKAVVECDNSVTELLIQHKEKKLDKILTKKAVVQCDSTLTELIKENEILKDIVMKQPVVYCENTVKRPFSYNINNESGLGKTNIPKTSITKKDLIYLEEEEILENHNVGLDIPKSTEDSKPKNNDIEINKKSNIKNRLVFEDDISDFEDDIISTQYNELITDLSIGDENIFDLTMDDSGDGVTNLNSLKIESQVKETKPLPSNIKNSEENVIPSVHYEDLIVPSTMKCKFCNMLFKNRYSLLTHEASQHLIIKQKSIYRSTKLCNICDRYIVGNHKTLRHHKNEKHPLVAPRNGNMKNCSICKLKYYTYGRHCINYHQIHTCPTCSKTFADEPIFSDHIKWCKESFDSSLPNITEDRIGKETFVKVCELCSLFLKNTQMYKYILMGTRSEQGKRISCERCEKQFFEVKLIKLVNKHPIVQPSYDRQKIPKAPAQPAITNEKRLKNIQKRLKLIKQIS